MIPELLADLTLASLAIPKHHPHAPTIALIEETLSRERAASTSGRQTRVRSLRPPATPLSSGIHVDFDLAGANVVAAAFEYDDTVLSVVGAQEPNGTRLSSGGGRLTLIDTLSGDQLAPPLETPSAIHAMGVSPDGARVVLGDDNGQLHVVETATGQVLRKFDSGHGVVGSHKIIVIPASQSHGIDLRLALESLHAHEAEVEVREAAAAVRGKPWSSAYSDEFERDQGRIFHVRWMADGSRFATAREDATIRIWSAQTLDLERVIESDEPRFFDGLAVTAPIPRHGRLVTGSLDSAMIWNIAAHAEPILMRGHDAGVTAAAVSSDSDIVATADEDGCVIVWRVSSGSEIRRMNNGTLGHVGIADLAFSADGHWLAAGGNHFVWVWAMGDARAEPQSGRPAAGSPAWCYFHGDSGGGRGASHQTGWTAIVALLIQDS